MNAHTRTHTHTHKRKEKKKGGGVKKRKVFKEDLKELM